GLLITLRRAGIRVRQVGLRHFPRTAHAPKGASARVLMRAIRDVLRLRAGLWLYPHSYRGPSLQMPARLPRSPLTRPGPSTRPLANATNGRPAGTRFVPATR